MCGRFSLKSNLSKVGEVFDCQTSEQAPPRYNISPTQPVHVVLKEHGMRNVKLMRWGFIPSWVKEPETFSLIINARSETALQKPSFKSAIRYRRCIIPANGFYEWKRDGSQKIPYFIKPKEQEIVGYAGIYETYMAKNGSEIDTMCFLTTSASADISKIHHRMPVLIAPDKAETWLDSHENRAEDLGFFFDNHKTDNYDIIPVSNRVNNARNDDPTLQDEVEKTEELDKKETPLPTDQLSLF